MHKGFEERIKNIYIYEKGKKRKIKNVLMGNLFKEDEENKENEEQDEKY